MHHQNRADVIGVQWFYNLKFKVWVIDLTDTHSRHQKVLKFQVGLQEQISRSQEQIRIKLNEKWKWIKHNKSGLNYNSKNTEKKTAAGAILKSISQLEQGVFLMPVGPLSLTEPTIVSRGMSWHLSSPFQTTGSFTTHPWGKYSTTNHSQYGAPTQNHQLLIHCTSG